MPRIIFHIDVNNAFLSWTAVKLLKEGYNIDIRTIPAVIGGDESKRHGIVLAKSPVAKKMGIKTAETLYAARKICPSIKVYPPDHEYYEEMSNKMFEIISKYSPEVEKFSIDECFVDFTGMNYIYDDFVELAYKIKDEIYDKLGFTVNVGVANNKLCAKMASDFEKPNKVHTLFMDEIEEKLLPLPVDDLFMVGKKTSEKLHSLGINTIKELRDKDFDYLTREFKSQGEYLYNSSRGIDDTPVDGTVYKSKSISVSWTLEKDTDDIDYIKNIILKQTDEVGRNLRKENMYAKTIAITYKNKDFQSYSRQITLEEGIDSNDEIYKNVINLLEKTWDFEKIRNIGIRLSNLSEEKVISQNLFKEDKKDNTKFQKALDSIKDKYGSDIINPASILERK
jgi:DNA polymerase-4